MTEYSAASNIRDRVDRIASAQGSERAITYTESVTDLASRSDIDFDRFARDVRQRTAALLALGVKPGETIAGLLPLSRTAYQVFLSAMLTGVVAPLNYFLEAPALVELIEQVGATVLLTPADAADDPSFAAKMSTIRERLPDLRHIVFGGAPFDGASPLETAIEGGGMSWPDGLPDDIERDMVLMLTGGTTGKSKIVPHTEAMYLALFEAGAHAQGTVRGERMLSGLPLFHTSGTVNAGLIPLMAGASIFIPSARGFRDQAVIQRYWDLVRDHEITIGAAVPTALAAIATTDPGGAVPTLKHILVGGAPLPQATADAIRDKAGAEVVNGWGMTETCGFSVLNPLTGAQVATVGTPFDGVDVEIRLPDATGELARVAGEDEIGEVVVRGSTVIKRYLEDYPNAFTRDGWLRTGDLARVAADGHMTITGRAKDIIIRGGHNIDPGVIENAAYRHPAIELAAAVGRPDSHAGEMPILFVQLRAAQSVSETELLDFIRPLITERAAVPKAIHVLTALPLSGPGKISKLALRKQAAADVFQREIDAAAPNASVTVSVSDDPRHGIVAKLASSAPVNGADRDAIEATLGRYSIAVEWGNGVVS